MITKLYQEKEMFIGVNHRNQLVVDMSEKQMNDLFVKRFKRPANSSRELEAFLQQLIASQLVNHRLIKRKK